MKKILALTVFNVLGVATIQAQEINFGAKGGFNIATLTGDNSSSLDEVSSFHFGAIAEIKLFEKFSFQPEILYSGQGYSEGDNTIELNYLNVSLMGKYYLTKGFSLEAGPQVGFLRNAKLESIDLKDAYKTVDFGVNLGLGYKLDNGLNFGARYNVGLTNINENSGANNRNGVLQVSVGYFFL